MLYVAVAPFYCTRFPYRNILCLIHCHTQGAPLIFSHPQAVMLDLELVHMHTSPRLGPRLYVLGFGMGIGAGWGHTRTVFQKVTDFYTIARATEMLLYVLARAYRIPAW